MKIRLPSNQRRLKAFSLLEMLLVATLMTAIVYGLYSMFDQTQRALRGNTSQVDVLEGGRSALDFVTRELEQVAPCGLGNCPNIFNTVHFPNATYPNPIIQELNPPTTPPTLRTNVVEEVFFLTFATNCWAGNAYYVGSYTNSTNMLGEDGVGTLYRMTITNLYPDRPMSPITPVQIGNMLAQYHGGRSNSSPVVDGVVHFKLEAYDRHGVWMDPDLYPNPYRLNYPPPYPGYTIHTVVRGQAMPSTMYPTNVVLQEAWLQAIRLPATQFFFLSNALPAYLDIELGVLEPQAWQKVLAIPNADAKRQYLKTHAGQVHLFRKRIAIRPSANEL